MPKIPNRASPLPLEERKAAIIEAVIPVMIENGAAITSRQIAEAAGVAEGTVFRAFGDKETLLREAAEVYLDPAPLRASLANIDSTLSLQNKVELVLGLLQERFHGVISIMAAIGRSGDEWPRMKGRPPQRDPGYTSLVAEAITPELELLNVPPEDVAPYIRLIAFATSIPAFTAEKPFDRRELARLIVYGIAGDATAGDEDASRTHSQATVAARKLAERRRADLETEPSPSRTEKVHV